MRAKTVIYQDTEWTIPELSKKFNIDKNTLGSRIRRGMTVEEALDAPLNDAKRTRVEGGVIFQDLTGQTFGRWKVISHVGKVGTIYTFRCKCECGNENIVRSDHLRNGTSLSCGCGAGRTTPTEWVGTPTHTSWRSMHSRCRDIGNKMYSTYGGLGIIVCDRWKLFKNFLEDMGERPVGKSIDRIDSTGNYEPDNCKWSTPKEQMNNLTNRKHTK
jgi:hypothetical protein